MLGRGGLDIYGGRISGFDSVLERLGIEHKQFDDDFQYDLLKFKQESIKYNLFKLDNSFKKDCGSFDYLYLHLILSELLSHLSGGITCFIEDQFFGLDSSVDFRDDLVAGKYFNKQLLLGDYDFNFGEDIFVFTDDSLTCFSQFPFAPASVNFKSRSNNACINFMFKEDLEVRELSISNNEFVKILSFINDRYFKLLNDDVFTYDFLRLPLPGSAKPDNI